MAAHVIPNKQGAIREREGRDVFRSRIGIAVRDDIRV
jgi:hypothetical protein